MPRKRSRSRQTAVRSPGADYSIQILGDRPAPLRDFYHALLRRPWRVTIAAISAAFLLANAVFALAYLATGGIAHARPQSFVDAYFFSVQTMGTIGYGAMFPESGAANVLVVGESITSLLLTALATGMVFAKFSRSTARIAFSRQVVISPVDGIPTLMFRISNQRGNRIVDVQIRVVIVRKQTHSEGHTFYPMLDLHLTREHALSLSRSWSVMHIIDSTSPLFGRTPDVVADEESELSVMVIGLDETSMQPIHASHQYFARQILWGARHSDIISEAGNGDLILDMDKFDDTESTAPTQDFPYPRAAS